MNINKKVGIKQFPVNTISYVWFRSRKLVRKLSAFVIQGMESEIFYQAILDIIF